MFSTYIQIKIILWKKTVQKIKNTSNVYSDYCAEWQCQTYVRKIGRQRWPRIQQDIPRTSCYHCCRSNTLCNWQHILHTTEHQNSQVRYTYKMIAKNNKLFLSIFNFIYWFHHFFHFLYNDNTVATLIWQSNKSYTISVIQNHSQMCFSR